MRWRFVFLSGLVCGLANVAGPQMAISAAGGPQVVGISAGGGTTTISGSDRIVKYQASSVPPSAE